MSVAETAPDLLERCGLSGVSELASTRYQIKHMWARHLDQEVPEYLWLIVTSSKSPPLITALGLVDC
jgi:hypothetical protein